MSVGERIRSNRKASGLSQEALARRADVSMNVIARLERGEIRDPHLTTLMAVADALNLSVGELLGEESRVPLAQAPPETAQEGAEVRRERAGERVLGHEQALQEAAALADWAQRYVEHARKELDHAVEAGGFRDSMSYQTISIAGLDPLAWYRELLESIDRDALSPEDRRLLAEAENAADDAASMSRTVLDQGEVLARLSAAAELPDNVRRINERARRHSA